MPARDDSVIRGSLITSLIVLVLSLALNFFLYRWGSTSSIENERLRTQLASAQDELRTNSERLSLLKAMIGEGTVSEAEFERLQQSASGDPEMEAIERRFVQDMAYLGPEVDAQNRNYQALPEYFVNAMRTRNDQVVAARTEVTNIRTNATSDIANARTAQAKAEEIRDDAIAKLEKANAEYVEDREKMKQTTEETRDKLTQVERAAQAERRAASEEKNKIENQLVQVRSIVETQRQELNQLRSDRFEHVQGEITYVVPPGRMVHINLGSADALRPGVQFAVVDVHELNVEDAEIKAQLQVTKILSEHSAQARIVGEPSFRNPLVLGDKLYSPFWAPGRKVRIALAGDIDITGDGRSNVEDLKSMISNAGAEVIELELTPEGEVRGELDSSIRFLVVGEEPIDEGGLATEEPDPRRTQAIAALGRAKARAMELGITPIPAWKLLEYLKGISDTIPTPLGSAVRGSDFQPEPMNGAYGRDASTVLPEIYRNQVEGQRNRNRGR